MDKRSALILLDAAWEEINKIDLRGHRTGTVLHDVVVAAKDSVAAAYNELLEEVES